MRLDYLDYQIVYLEDTGDASVYAKNKEIIRASIPRSLNRENLIKNLSLGMAAPGLIGSRIGAGE
ncbi:MAG: hypothetical protein J6Q41_08420 [Firmicutes bacterium]|nr:hypothetical protein [Bacillota bacterium]